MFKFIIKYILSRQSTLKYSRTAFIEDSDSYGLDIPGDKFLFKIQDNLKFNRNNFKRTFNFNWARKLVKSYLK